MCDTENMYTGTNCTPYSEDYLRITFTPFWLSSYRLCAEMGRWSRVPPEQRICQCETVFKMNSIYLCVPLKKTSERNMVVLGLRIWGSNRGTLPMLHACLSLLEQQKVQAVRVRRFCIVLVILMYCIVICIFLKCFYNGFLNIVWTQCFLLLCQ